MKESINKAVRVFLSYFIEDLHIRLEIAEIYRNAIEDLSSDAELDLKKYLLSKSLMYGVCGLMNSLDSCSEHYALFKAKRWIYKHMFYRIHGLPFWCNVPYTLINRGGSRKGVINLLKKRFDIVSNDIPFYEYIKL